MNSYCNFLSRKEKSKKERLGYYYLDLIYMWKTDHKRKDGIVASLLWWSGNDMINDCVRLDKTMGG